MHLRSFICSVLGALSALTISTTTAVVSSNTNDTRKPLRVGVVYEKVALSDLAGLEFLGHQTPEIMAQVAKNNPILKALLNGTTPMEFLYISSSLDAAMVTPRMYVQPTHTYDNAPRDLDILYIGGPDTETVDERSLTFLLAASKKTRVVLTTCTGAMWLAKSGALDGKKATTNRMSLSAARNKWPNVDWLDQRWVIEDGHFEGAQIWTSGGAGCGVDMLIEYADRTFDKRIVQLGCQGLDFPYENRSQFYTGPLAPLPIRTS